VAKKKKCNWTGHTLKRTDDSLAEPGPHWTLQDHTGRGRPKNTWETDL